MDNNNRIHRKPTAALYFGFLGGQYFLVREETGCSRLSSNVKGLTDAVVGRHLSSVVVDRPVRCESLDVILHLRTLFESNLSGAGGGIG